MNTDDGGIPGLKTGDLLDDGSNHMMRPWYTVPGQKPLLVYREHIVAHSKWDADREESIEEVNSNLFS
ncbi:MAG: hypothetical protein IJF20_03080 [Clostridia bacterium]|nr:hypothetical protein [Clostridia bacterium]